MNLIEYFEDIYRRERLLGKSPQTLRAYRSQLKLLEELAGRTIAIADLDNQVVGDAIDQLIQEGGAVASANKLLKHVGAVWRHAILGGASSNVCRIRPLKELRRIPRVFTLEEFEDILAVARGLPQTADTVGKRSLPERVGRIRACLFWEALLLAAYYTGLRVTALLSIRWTDIDLERAELVVRAETQKQRADQLFELPADLVAALERIRGRGRGVVFSWPLDRRADGQPSGRWDSLRRHLRRITETAGAPQGARFLWHGVRRLTATQATRSGGLKAARELLDHSSDSVTRRYIDPRQTPDRVRPGDVLPTPRSQSFRVVRGESG